MASPKKHNLGVFAAGEIPYPVVHRFSVGGVPINLAGFTAFVHIEGPEGPTLGAGTIDITDAGEGLVEYTWNEDDFQGIGNHKMLIWVQDGTNRFASDLIIYNVYDGPGPTPPDV